MSITRRGALAATASLSAPAIARASGMALRLAHGLPRSHPVHSAMAAMVDEIRERSGGEVEIAIFPDGELGQEIHLVEPLRAGRLHLAKFSASVLERRLPDYGVFSLPFLLRDAAHWQAVTGGEVGGRILASGMADGLHGLTFYEAGARSFYGNRPVGHPDDLRGMKIRIQSSPLMMRTVSILGAQPVQMSWEATYNALLTKLVDGAENSVAALIVGRHAEVIRFYGFDEHTMVPDVLLMNGDLWTGLSGRLREVFATAAERSALRMAELWTAFQTEARAASETLGVTFTKADKAAFAERTAPIRRDLGDPRLEALIRDVERASRA